MILFPPLTWLRAMLDRTEFTFVPYHELDESERPPALHAWPIPLVRKAKR